MQARVEICEIVRICSVGVRGAAYGTDGIDWTVEAVLGALVGREGAQWAGKALSEGSGPSQLVVEAGFAVFALAVVDLGVLPGGAILALARGQDRAESAGPVRVELQKV